MPSVFSPDIPSLPKVPFALPEAKKELKPPKPILPTLLTKKKQSDSDQGILSLLAPLLSSPS